MNNFDRCEEMGRSLFKSVLDKSPKVKSYIFSTDKYSCWDCIYTDIHNHTNVVELKYRDRYSSTDNIIVTEGAMLEKFKYDTLMNHLPHSSHYYVMLFNDGVGYIWDLSKVKPRWFDKECPQTTAVKGERVMKIISTLPLEEGTRFEF